MYSHGDELKGATATAVLNAKPNKQRQHAHKHRFNLCLILNSISVFLMPICICATFGNIDQLAFKQFKIDVMKTVSSVLILHYYTKKMGLLSLTTNRTTGIIKDVAPA